MPYRESVHVSVRLYGSQVDDLSTVIDYLKRTGANVSYASVGAAVRASLRVAAVQLRRELKARGIHEQDQDEEHDRNPRDLPG